MADVPAVEAIESTKDTGLADEQAAVELYLGSELSASETETITLRWPTQLVVLAGAEGSGKTTVLTSLYENLCQGQFAGYNFAGSRSLLGFEKICHANRLASNGTRPVTERTIPTDETSYYHLALRKTTDNLHRQNVLLSALSGELYRWARNSREECEKLTFLHRANTIVVLVDGEKLASPEQRENARADAAGILDSFLDAQMIAPNCQVEVVFSKLDRIRAAGEPALEFLKLTQRKLETKFRSRLPKLAFRQIAARPSLSPDTDELREGLNAAFSAWTTSLFSTRRNALEGLSPPSEAREFIKFGWRHAGESWREIL